MLKISGVHAGYGRTEVIHGVDIEVPTDGVVAVIDSGLARVADFDPSSGLPRLSLTPISRASAAQRAGRAGRTRAGVCIRLYGRHDHDTRPEQQLPEIRRLELSGLVLELAGAGVRDAAAFEWFEAPSTAALGVAALFPIRSLGPSPGDTLYRTPWRRGMRLRDETGRLVKAGELEQGSFATVFPETAPGSADGQAVLVRVDPTSLRLPEDRADGAPDGYVCYSKVCTHLGCPIGLYLAQTHELRCPCHQSTFDVLNGAEPVYGPADRPLPQLLLEVDDEGYLTAKGDFTGPVGPGFWTIDKGPEGTGVDPL